MRFAFTDDQLAFRDAVRSLLAAECPPALVRAVWDDGLEAARPLWQKLAEMGVVGILAPEGAGGLGLGEVDLVLLAEEAGRVVLPAPLVETAGVAIPLLRDVGHHEEWLAAAAAGDAFVAVGEVGAPTAFARDADVVLVRDGDALVVLPRGAGRVEPLESGDGARRLASVTPVADHPGKPLAPERFADVFDRGALFTAAQLCGVTAAMLDLTVEYAKERQQFGAAIGSYQAVKPHLANVLIDLEYARPLVHRAAWSLQEGLPERSVHVAMAKAFASDAAERAAKRCLQVHGAIGYTTEYDLHLWLKRAWVLAVSWGDARLHRRRIAAARV